MNHRDFVATFRALSLVPKREKNQAGVQSGEASTALLEEEDPPCTAQPPQPPLLLRRVIDTGTAIVDVCLFLGVKDAVSLCCSCSKAVARIRGRFPWHVAILARRIAGKWGVAEESLILDPASTALGDIGPLGKSLASFQLVSFPAPLDADAAALSAACHTCGCQHEQMCGACARERLHVEAWPGDGGGANEDLFEVSCAGCRFRVVLRATPCLESLTCNNLTMQICELCHTPTEACADCETRCSACDKATCDNCHSLARDGLLMCDDCCFFCVLCQECTAVEDEYTSCEACDMVSCRDCFDGLICEGPSCQRLLW